MTTNQTQPTDTTTTPEPATAALPAFGPADIAEAIQAADQDSTSVPPDQPGEPTEPDSQKPAAPVDPVEPQAPVVEPELKEEAAQGKKTPRPRPRLVVLLGVGLGLVTAALLITVVWLSIQAADLGHKLDALEEAQETDRLAAIGLAQDAAASYGTAATDARTAISKGEVLVAQARAVISDGDRTSPVGLVTLDQLTQATDALDQAIADIVIADPPPVEDTALLADALAQAQATSQATTTLTTQTGRVTATQATLATLLEVWDATQAANAQTAGDLQAALDAHAEAADRLATTIDDYESFLLQIGEDGDTTARQMLRVLLDEATAALNTELAADATIEDVTKATETLNGYDSALQEGGDLVASTLTNTNLTTADSGTGSGGKTTGTTSSGNTTKPSNNGGNTSNNAGSTGNQTSGLTGDALCKSLLGDTAYSTGVDGNGTTQCQLPPISCTDGYTMGDDGVCHAPPNYVNADDVRAQLEAAFPHGTEGCGPVGGFGGDSTVNWAEWASTKIGGYGPARFEVTQLAPDSVKVLVYSCVS